MFSKLTDIEIKAIDKLLRFGLSRAVLALKGILATEVSLESLDFDLKREGEAPNYCTKKDKKTHLLKTELVGEVKGFCHLIFSEYEVEKIQNACLPEEVLNNNNPETRLMKLEFLTEIDNMVAGAVITQLSNHLSMEIYGNVPSLHVMQAEEVNKYIQAESVLYNSEVEFRAVFKMPFLNIESEFVWLLQDTMLDKIRENAESVIAQEFE